MLRIVITWIFHMDVLHCWYRGWQAGGSIRKKEKSSDRWRKDNISKVLNTSNHNNNGTHNTELLESISFFPPSIETIVLFCHSFFFLFIFLFVFSFFGFSILCALFFPFFGKRFTCIDKILPFFSFFRQTRSGEEEKITIEIDIIYEHMEKLTMSKPVLLVKWFFYMEFIPCIRIECRAHSPGYSIW